MEQRHDRDSASTPGPDVRAADDSGQQPCRFRAFISYSHSDQRWADWLFRALETYRVPSRLVGTETTAGRIPKRLSPVFRDRDELASAADLGDKIRSALAASSSLIVICSPASAASRWVNEEILAYKRLGRSHRIFCLIVDGEPNASAHAGREQDECFAPALRHALDADGNLSAKRTEPVAADAREGKDGKSNARLKLIAGLLSVGFDVLKRREQQRRMRHMIVATALSLLVMLVTTALAVTAVISRQAAEAAQQAAERRQKQAEGLVSFMLGDLNDKLHEVNRLDIMQSVDDRAMAYFASLPVSDVTDRSLAMRATALQKIGEVRMDQGHLDKALDAFKLALDINVKRLKQAPDDPSHLNDYGGSQTWVGFAYWFRGDLTSAERCFRTALGALTRSLAVQPDRPDTQRKLAVDYNNLGQVLVKQRRLKAALIVYSRQIVLFRKLLAHAPGNDEYTTDMGNTEGSMAALEWERGELLSSISRLLIQQRIFAGLAKRKPADRDVKQSLMISDAILADALHDVGRQPLAMRYIGKAVALGTELVKFDPNHADWRARRAFYLGWQAKWRNEIRPGSKSARLALTKARRELARLLAANPSDTNLRRKLAMTRNALAVAFLDARDTASALHETDAAQKTLHPLLSLNARSALNRRSACLTELLLSRTHAGERARHLARALEFIQPLARTSDNPDNLSLWALTLLASNRPDAARPALRKLRDMGYRTHDLTAALAHRHLPYAPASSIQTQLDAMLAMPPGPAVDASSAPGVHDAPGTWSAPTPNSKDD